MLVTIAYVIGIRWLPLTKFFSLLKCLKLKRASSYFAFPRTILGLIYIIFIAARLSGTCLLMSTCCNSVNKSNLQFSGRTFIYKQSVRDLTLAQFLKHVIIPQKQQVFHYKYSKTPHWRFQEKRNRSNTSTGARPDRMVRFILGELFDTWSWQPNDRKWFWLDGIESCCVGVEGSSKSICVRRFSPSALSLFRFHLSPFPPETPDTQATSVLTTLRS